MSRKLQQSLQGLKAVSLRQLLNSIGSKQSGNKAQLAERLGQQLIIPKLPFYGSSTGKTSTPRILSIDMGIKNLAYCLVTANLPKSGDDTLPDQAKPRIHVNAWERVSVLETEDPATPEDTEEIDLFSPAALAPVALRLVR